MHEHDNVRTDLMEVDLASLGGDDWSSGEAFNRWVEWYEDIKQQQFRISGAINRLMNRKLSMAWERWQFWYEEMMEQIQLSK